MLKSIKLLNFQSHKGSLLELDPGVNVIIGSTDSGKTSIIRALRKLIWNRPLGDAMRSTWGGTTAITVRTEQDKVTWMKNNTESGYRLNTQTHFKAVGTDVPTEIRQAFNINEINLQSQLDSPFLLTSSPGEVAAHFNKVAKLNQIDEGLKNVNSWIRGIDRKIDANELILTNSEQQLKEYDHLEKFDIEVEALEGMGTKRNGLNNDYYALTGIHTHITELDKDIEEEQEILTDADLVDNVLDLIYKRDALEEGPVADVEALIFALKNVDELIQEHGEIIALESQVNALLDREHELQEKEQRLQELYTLSEDIGNVDSEILTYGNKLRHAEKEFEKAFPQICPLCGKPK